MKTTLNLRVNPEDAANTSLTELLLTKHLGFKPAYWNIIKKSIDARQKQIKIQLTIAISDQAPERALPINYNDVQGAATTCHIIGTGPAGLFAALRCLEQGIKPILIERGKAVRARRRDLALIQRQGHVNTDSNYCFGEGGAGTYSDGKLYTRSGSRREIELVLNTLVAHGANEDIRVEAHPHIGTNKLPEVIQNIRNRLIQHGAEFYFETRLTDITHNASNVNAIEVQQGASKTLWPVQNLILATGHSARDIYYLLHKHHLQLQFKPFALGFRIEHPQAFIDEHQYHCSEQARETLRKVLPAASYQLVTQTPQAPVYSFCMCPGGVIAPCATAPAELVTNGWSPSKRNNPFANAGIVAGIDQNHVKAFAKHEVFAGLAFQQHIEQKAFQWGGGKLVAPAQRAADFLQNKTSSSLPKSSYIPGLHAVNLNSLFTPDLAAALKTALKTFNTKIKGFAGNEALLVATESRTSTPIRIPRQTNTLTHPQLNNLYPCGEGAGYAGGIVSAAIDGQRVVDAMCRNNM
jgi:uncharacterized FAD-dependent dehydrogenase